MAKKGFLSRATRQWTVFPDAQARIDRARALVASKDFRKGLRQLDKMAQGGDAQAQYVLGDIYLTGANVPLNPREAVRWLKKAAENEQPDALFKLAILHESGYLLEESEQTDILSMALPQAEPNSQKALECALRASDIGHADSMAFAAHILTHGPSPLRNVPRARALLKDSAERGSVHGLLGYGMVLLEGAQKEEDRAYAVTFIQKAAEKGSGQAYYTLGLLAAQENTQPSAQRAFHYFLQGAEKNSVPAQLKLGVAYYHGLGVERDVSRAETWLRKAAQSGDVEAAALVGDINLQGDGETPNFIEALIWYRKAVEGGHIASAVTLGQMVYNGAGTPKNVPEAKALFQFAAQKGNAQAKQLLRLLEAQEK